MGLIVQTPLETNVGDIESFYAVIPNYTVNRNTGYIKFSIAYFTDKKYYDLTKPSTLEETYKTITLPSDARFNPAQVLYGQNDDWNEISLPQYIETYFVNKEETEIPIYEKQEITKKVPYVSFDKEGNEIEIEREEIVEEEVIVDYKTEVKEVIDYKLVEKPLKFAYKHLSEILSVLLPKSKVKNG